nr:MAG TPA: replicative helicase [Caudoviricetes sp.]
MEQLKMVLKRLNMARGCNVQPRRTPEEIEQARADNFNQSPGDLNEVDGYDCQVCHNKGVIMLVVAPGGRWSTATKDCKCMKTRKTIRQMQRSGLKNVIRDLTFSKFEAAEAWQQTLKQAAMDYAANPTGWFYIGGQSGIGKSHLCTAICREFLLAGREVKYMLWRDEINQLKGVFADVDAHNKLMDTYKRVEVLYIDDLFKTGRDKDNNPQRPTAADINVAFEIINARSLDPELLTIISSECTTNDLLDIDEATGGRICEKAQVFSIAPDRAKNYRLRKVTEL